MSEVKYLLDEHIASFYRRELLKRDPTITVWRVGATGAPPLETPDPELLRWCERHSFILVTNNRKTMPKHLRDHLEAGGHVLGIFIIRAKTPIPQIIENLWLIWGASQAEEYQDRIEYLPLF